MADSTRVAIRWCEAEVMPFEYSNTLSNLWFLVAALAGLRVAKKRRLSQAFVTTEYMLIVVFFGSVSFHATQSWRAELFDELPMAGLALCYLFTVSEVHWITRGSWRTLVFALGGGGAAVGMAVYVFMKNFEIFSIIFTLQVLLPALIAFTAGPDLGCDRRVWFLFLGLILTGKLVWELERHLWRSDTCPTSIADPLYWLHALWHFFSAAAHHAAMVYHGDLFVAMRDRKRAKAP